jgi:prephenate dehydrogenase
MVKRVTSLPQPAFAHRGAKVRTRNRKVSLRQAGISSIGICGVGLIGGSIAERLRSRKLPLKILGHDRKSVLNVAASQKLIDEVASPAEMLRVCDMVILSANPATNQKILRSLSRQDTDRSPLIIDTGSTQSGIAELGKSLDWKNRATFVAGHPMAGREVQGIESRLAELFEGHPFFFDQSVQLNSDHRILLEWFTGEIGSFTMYVDNTEHDTVMTDISHIPQLLSTVMGGFVSHHDKRTIHLAGTGLQSMIRLGGSPYSNWRDVFEENSERLCKRLDVLIRDLTLARDKIHAGESLQDSFQKARRGYSCLW